MAQNPIFTLKPAAAPIMTSLGQQHLAEFYDCNRELLNNKSFVRVAMVEAAKVARATIVADVFHEFNPHGISGVVVIAESHIAIHSWPEHGCASVDLFTCSHDMDPGAAIEYLKKTFEAKDVEVRVVARGQIARDPSIRNHVVSGI